MGAMTVRLDDGLQTRLQLVADVEGRPMSDVISEAVTTYCDAKLSNEAFRTRAQNHINKLRNVLDARGGRP